MSNGEDNELVPVLGSFPRKQKEPEPEEPQERELPDVDLDEPDPFIPVIARYLKMEGPIVRDAIVNTPCFARGWWHEEHGICANPECHLMTRCESAYEQAVGKLGGPEQMELTRGEEEEEEDETDGEPLGFIRYRKKTGVHKQRTKPKKRTVRYVDRGRPSDEFVNTLREALNFPVELPPVYHYAAMNTYQDRMIARDSFIKRYGEGFTVAARATSWTLFWNGLHVCRISLHTALVVWVECNPWLVAELEKMKFKVDEIVRRDVKPAFPVYTGRIKMWSLKDAEDLAKAIEATALHMSVRQD